MSKSGRATLGIICVILVALASAGPDVPAAAASGACDRFGDKYGYQLRARPARRAIICLVNKERTARGLARLRSNSRLQRAAQNHNDYMQNHNCFSHECSGEASLTGRLQNAGWLTGGLTRWAYGENIAWGAGKLGTPKSIVNAWMNSSGHRANILSRTFDEVGVGYSKGTISSRSANGSVMTTDFGYKVR